MNDTDRNERPETLAAILAEMRERFAPYAKSYSNDARYVAYLGYKEFADRIEAAAWRERGKAATIAAGKAINLTNEKSRRESGNAAALREALVVCKEEMCSYCRDYYDDMPCVKGCEALRVAKAALSKPARNCDRFEDALDARAEWDMIAPLEEGDAFDWLFAPAEGGAE